MKFTKPLKARLSLLVLLTLSQWLNPVWAQLTGTKTIPGDYATIAAAVTDLNTLGVGASGVTFNVAAGHTETATASILLTATGTAANPVVFQKSGAGANPVITAYTGTSTSVDGIFVLAGSDYITIDGIDLMENSANTTATQQMEWGYALVKRQATAPFNGCQNVTIKNCNITLNRTNTASTGIYSGNHIAANTTTLTITVAADANSNDIFTGNTIQNAYWGIKLNGFGTAALYDQGNIIGQSGAGNTIQNFCGGGTNAAGIYVINQNAVNISYNTVNNTAGGGVAAATTLSGIQVAAAADASVTNNNVNVQMAGLSNQLYAIRNSGGTGNIIISNNTLQASYSATASSELRYISFEANATSETANNNSFTGSTLNTTGSVYLVYNSNNTATYTINNNVTTGSFNKTGAGGTFYGHYNNGSPGTGTGTLSGNNFSNITLTGSTGFYGLHSTTTVTQTINMTGNTISNITTGSGTLYGINFTYGASNNNIANNTISNFTGTSTIYGIVSGGTTSSTSTNINGNTINTLSTTGAATVYGLQVLLGNTNNIYRNKIYDLTANNASGLVYGITIAGGTTGSTNNIYNNLVGDLKTPITSSGSSAVIGLNITSTSTTSNINVYYNNIYLNATSTGTNFHTTGIYHTTSGTATTAALNLRNNIIVNTSTPNGTGLTVAYRRSGTNLTNYATTSNNNIFYAGTPGASRLIFNDGTNSDQTLAAFQTRVGTTREAASKTENVAFTSTAGSSSSFLHVNTVTPSYAESGGANIATYTNDFDNDIRQGNAGYAGTGTAPDIGADEFEGTVVPQCAGTPAAGSITGTATVCSGAGTTLNFTGGSTAPGVSYQWASSTTMGGPYTTPMGTGVTQATGTLTATTYYIVTSTCSFSGLTSATPEFTVTVNPLPVTTVTPTSSTFCYGGTAITLTAAGASTYVWSPAAGLSATTGTTVTASPAATTTYNVTGTSAAGCVGNTANATVTWAPAVNIGSVTATPNSVCSNGSTVLATSATTTGNYTVSSIPFAPVTDPGGASVLSGDDVMSSAITIPFSFSFYGINYTQLFACTNGFIQLGTNSASTSVYGQSLPSTTAPNNVIGGVWSDLNINASSGGVRTYTTGTTGSRVFTIHYYGAAFYNLSTTYTGAVDFYISLFEADNHIEVHVDNATPGASTANRTLGIENAGGTAAVTPAGRNGSTWSVTGGAHEAWKFTPSGGTITYTWSETPGTTLTSTTGASVNATNILANTTYTVVATDATGCSATGNVNVTAGAALICTGITGSSAICTSTSLTLTAGITGGGSPYNYSWSDGSATVYPNTASITTSTLAPGTYNFTLTVTDGCTNTCTSSKTVVVSATPTASISGVVSPLCAGNDIHFTGNTDVGTSFNWTGPNSFTSTLQNPTITGATVAASGTYTFTSTLGTCTSAPATVSVTVNPSPTSVTAGSGAASICAGNTVNLTATANAYGVFIDENFNGAATGWTTSNTSTGGTPANAAWTLRASPHTPGGAWTGTMSSNDNSQFYFTNSDAQGSSGTSTVTILQSPAFSTIGYTGVSLNMFHHYNDDGVSSDNGYVEVSTNGTTWTTVQTYTSDQGTATAFANPTINLNAYAGNPTVYVRFRYTGVYAWGWAIDNVKISGTPATYTYNWSSAPAGFTSTTQNPTGVVPSGTTTYTVTATNVFGCSLSGNTTVTVNPLPTVSVSGTTTICDGSSTTLTASGASTYTWSPAAGLSATTGTSVMANPTTTTTYTVTGTSADGCVSTTTVTVTVNPLPTVSVPSITICPAESGTLTASGALTYTWSPATGLSATTGTSVTANPSGTTVYTITGTDINGCVNTTTSTVTVNAVLAISVTGTTTICEGASTTLTASGASTYIWSPAAGLSATTGTSVTANPTTTTTYTVTGTSGMGCTGSTTVTVTVNPLPTVTATSDDADNTICNGDDIVLNGNGASTYVWDHSVTNGVAFVPAATTTYTITGTDVNSCQNTASITINVNNLPTVTAASDEADNTLCNGENIVLNGGGAVSYTWDNSVTNGIAFIPTASTTYTVTGTDVNGCQNTASINVNVNNLPIVTAASDDADNTLCAGSNITLNGGGAVSYTWDNSVMDDIAFATTTTTTYTVTGTDVNGCENTASITINVNGLPNVTATSDEADNMLCDGEDVVLTGNGASTYAWDNSVMDGVSFIPSTTTTYTVTGTDANGCENTASITINVNGLPTVTANSDDTDNTVCTGSNVTLNGGGAVSYVWDNSVMDGIGFMPADTATYTVTGTDINGCENTASITINVVNLPTVTATSDDADNTLCAGSNITLNGGGTVAYNWDNSVMDGIAFATTTTTTYTVTGADANGCENTASITINVNSLPAVTATSDDADNTLCNGSSVTLTGNGASTYAWDNSVNNGVSFVPATTTTYTVTGTDANGCENTASITISVNTVNVNTTTSGFTITAVATPATYQWINCSDNIPVTGATGQAFTATVNGLYAVVVTENSCTDTSTCVTITGIGMNELNAAVFALYPNPTSGAFTVEGSADANVTITGVNGELIMSTRIYTGKNQLHTGDIARGMYMVKITDPEGNLIATQRLVVTR